MGKYRMRWRKPSVPNGTVIAWAGWHVQFVEDTNLGFNDRVFADLIDLSGSPAAQTGMDAGYSPWSCHGGFGRSRRDREGRDQFPTPVSAAGEYLLFPPLLERGHRSMCCGYPMGGAEGDRPAYAASGFRSLAVRRRRKLARLPPQRRSLLGGAGNGGKNPRPSRSRSAPEGGDALLHLGLARAAGQRDFASHNRVPADERWRNGSIRTRFRFYLAMAVSALICALTAGGFVMAIRIFDGQAADLRARLPPIRAKWMPSGDYGSESAPGSLPGRSSSALARAYRLERDVGVGESAPQGGGDRWFTVVRLADGGSEISFKAWVRDWDQVQSIQKRLSASGRFTSITLSEQRKDLQTGVVLFHVTARMGND